MLRLGVLANFLSRPILIGFFTGISLSILVGQIKRVTGVDIESDGLLRPVLELLQKAASIHWPSLVLAVAMFGLLQIVRIVRFPVPGPVVVLVLSVVLSAVFDFEGRGIAVVGDIPTDLPSLTLPQLAGLPLETLALGSAAIFLVSFGSGIITARSFGAIGRLQGRTEPRAGRIWRREYRRRPHRRHSGRRLRLAHRSQSERRRPLASDERRRRRDLAGGAGFSRRRPSGSSRSPCWARSWWRPPSA